MSYSFRLWVVTPLEKFFAILVVLVALYFSWQSMTVLVVLDWTKIATFYEFINRVLLVTVAFELARLLNSHNINAVVDLLVFVVARKLLRPEMSAIDVLLGAIAFAILVIVGHHFRIKHKHDTDIDNSI